MHYNVNIWRKSVCPNLELSVNNTTAIDFSLMHLAGNKHGEQRYSMHRIIQKSILYNQTENGTTDEYYSSALHCAMSEWFSLESVLQHADERVSAVFKYICEHKSSKLINYLVQNNYLKTVKTIFETQDKHIVMDIINEKNVLHRAVESESVDMVEMLCTYGSEVNLKDENGKTALQLACELELLDIVQRLLGNGADPELTDTEGETALHKAATRANSKLMSVLLNHNKNIVDIADNLGQTAFLALSSRSYAIDEYRIIAAAYILNYNGASMIKSDNRGCTILHYAARYAYSQFALFILQTKKHRKLVHATDVEGRTLLNVLFNDTWICDIDRVLRTASVLTEHGASLESKDYHGRTPLDTVCPLYKKILIPFFFIKDSESNMNPRKPD